MLVNNLNLLLRLISLFFLIKYQTHEAGTCGKFDNCFNQRPQIKIEKTSKNKGRQTNFFEKQDTMKSAPLGGGLVKLVLNI